MGSNRHVGLVVGVCGCFLVPACVYCPVVGGGCGCVVGLGISVFGEHAHCRVHVQHRVSVYRPRGGGCLRSQPGSFVVWVWVVCGGLFVLCIVVASVFVLYCFLCFV